MVRSCSDNRKPNTFSSYNQYRISKNWCSGIYKSKPIIHHQINYMPWLIFYNSEALLLSVGSELKCFPTDRKSYPICKEALWKLEVPKVERNDIRTNDVSRFIISDNIIVCGNRDGSAAVYTFDDIRHKPVLLCHIEDCNENGMVEVSAVELITDSKKHCILTGSIYSAILRFWYCEVDENDSRVYSCPRARDIKLSHEVGIRCLNMDNSKEKLAIGLNGNSKPLLLDMNTGQLLLTADIGMNTRQTIRDIRWHDENTILYVTHSGKMQLTDIRTDKVIYDVMDPFQSTLYCVKSDGDRAIIVGTAEYSRCVLFDIRSDACHKQMYFTQKQSSPIYSLDFDSTKLIAATDRRVAVLNFNINSSSVPRKDYSQKFEFVNR
ncbi:hypothetical protein evm_010467 [Chilo suppressalis]|nr:hypothetical protein evm_010467 [Chilo suppressalis]